MPAPFGFDYGDGVSSNFLNGSGSFVPILVTASAPASASATGVAGSIYFDTSGSIYICTSGSVWKRLIATTW